MAARGCIYGAARGHISGSVYSHISVSVYGHISVSVYGRISVSVYGHISVSAYGHISESVYSHICSLNTPVRRAAPWQKPLGFTLRTKIFPLRTKIFLVSRPTGHTARAASGANWNAPCAPCCIVFCSAYGPRALRCELRCALFSLPPPALATSEERFV